MRTSLRLTRLWMEVRHFTLLIIGTLIAAIGYAVFQVPYDIAAGGVSGIGIIVNHFTDIPVSTFYFLVNLPLLILGFFTLGGWRFLIGTVISVLIFTAATEVIIAYLPASRTNHSRPTAQCHLCGINRWRGCGSCL